MNRDKQIEEMANDYYEAMLKARGTLGSMNEGAPKWYAKELYEKGYRKASEVAEEIFAEIEKCLPVTKLVIKDVGEFDFHKYGEKFYWVSEAKLAELKKKYESEKEK